ncbi:hypothetical protein CgunFtcFv8_008631 [Champsocephalus gunnari]|uniref:Uncharacterized protein n=1 Tax=Champsocephalus gunnari TaxID=52237 RepID=A0AAN8D1N1_CHAGU|nr:hypothetical protein CgunFtcFv8_008631 [Champsocephalus gunnari]
MASAPLLEVSRRQHSRLCHSSATRHERCPPRFRQQEHKQLLKRGQPLPSGTLPLTTTGRPATTEPAAAVATHSSPSCSSSSTSSLPTGQPRHYLLASRYL